MFISVNKRISYKEGREGTVSVCVLAQVWAFMVQDVGVSSEGSLFQLHHKAGFIIIKGRDREGVKDKWK